MGEKRFSRRAKNPYKKPFLAHLIMRLLHAVFFRDTVCKNVVVSE
jgi:hypothetical protein